VTELNQREGSNASVNRGADTRGNRGDEVAPQADGVFVRLWTRRPVSDRQIEVIDRLDALEAKGELTDVDVQTWPDKVTLSGHTRHTDVIRAYESIREWADEHDRTISPPFERRTVTSLVGRTEEVLSLPVLCLTVYDDELRGVFPHQDGNRVYSVPDFLDAFEMASDPAQVDAMPVAPTD